MIWHPCGPTPYPSHQDMDRSPPAWTLAAWECCWKPSAGSRRTLMSMDAVIFRGATVTFPGSRLRGCLRRMRYTVFRVTPTLAAMSPSRMGGVGIAKKVY